MNDTIQLIIAVIVIPLAMIIGWKVHPWTVGAMTQWVESPMQDV